MKARPRIAIVGAGNLGSALAVSLRLAGYEIEAVVARSGRASLRKARRLAQEVGARALEVGGLDNAPARVRADLIWFCVPDAEIAGAAQVLAANQSQNPRPLPAKSAGRKTGQPGFDWKGKIALHSSGALASDELDDLRGLGAMVASVHPLMTFVRGSRPWLTGVPFAIEGDAAAVRVTRRMVRDLGGHAYSIRKEDKAAYHAWGTFASPLLSALLATAEHVATLAGVSGKAARRRMIPILQQTLENYAAFGAAGGFSGPIVRGDVDTVQKHLRVLRHVPAAREVYAALARAALEYLQAKNRTQLMRVLKSSAN